MNKFATAILLGLVISAPLAISNSALKADAATTHHQSAAKATTKLPRHTRTRHTRKHHTTRPVTTKTLGVKQ